MEWVLFSNLLSVAEGNKWPRNLQSLVTILPIQEEGNDGENTFNKMCAFLQPSTNSQASFKPVQSSCHWCMSPENMVLLKVKQASLSIEKDNGPARMI